jgi:diguanylate cyclase (GGDEF)-like protein
MTSHQQATIFIAEAASHPTQGLVAILAAAGYQTRPGPETGSLLDLLKQPPDLVFIPVADDDRSYRLCQQIKANPALAHLPVIFIGTAEALADPTQVFASGGDDYVISPEIAADVVARVRRQLEGKRLELGAIAPATPLAPRPSLLKASLQRIHNSLDLNAILSTAVRDVRQQTQADRVVIYQFRSDGQGVITHEAVVDERLSVLNRQVNDACFDQDHAITYWSGRVGQIDDVAALGKVSQCYRDMLLSFDIKANLVVPIIHNLMGQARYLWGLIIVHQCHQPRRWSAEEVEMLRELSAHLAIAIQQSRLFNQVQRQARQEVLLNHILDEIRASFDVKHILTCTIDHLQVALNLRQCGITLLHHNLPKLPTPFLLSSQIPDAKVFDSGGPDPENPDSEIEVPPLEITDTLRRQLLLDSNLLVTPYLSHPAEVRPHSLQSVVQNQTTYVASPIRTDGQVQGVLWACPNPDQLAMAARKVGSWEYSDLRLIEEVAQQLGQALHQADLYQQLQTANDELQRLAHLDGLTQIANRREFDRYLSQEWQRLQREQGSLAMVLADVDHFKGFNDTYGHLSGDDCLRAIGQLLAQVTKRPADLAARYGGEEFALILPNTSPEGAIALVSEAQTHLNRLAIPNRASPLYGQVTLSFGVTALVPTLALSPEVLMQRADQALYAAKKAGRNGYCLWSEAIESGQEHSAEGAR